MYFATMLASSSQPLRVVTVLCLRMSPLIDVHFSPNSSVDIPSDLNRSLAGSSCSKFKTFECFKTEYLKVPLNGMRGAGY